MLSLYCALIDDEQDRLRFEDIFYSYSKQMHEVARGVLFDAHLAEDAVQNALLSIAKNIKTIEYEHPNVVRAYVLTAAKNSAINLLEKEKRETYMNIPYEDISYEGKDSSMYEKIVTKDMVNDVKEAMKQLPLMYREVLMLKYVNEMEYSEISKVLGKPQSTIRQQVGRAKKVLASICKKEGIRCEM